VRARGEGSWLLIRNPGELCNKFRFQVQPQTCEHSHQKGLGSGLSARRQTLFLDFGHFDNLVITISHVSGIKEHGRI
jgi:hypothetical protein